jgi:hypothetical protein
MQEMIQRDSSPSTSTSSGSAMGPPPADVAMETVTHEITHGECSLPLLLLFFFHPTQLTGVGHYKAAPLFQSLSPFASHYAAARCRQALPRSFVHTAVSTR